MRKHAEKETADIMSNLSVHTSTSSVKTITNQQQQQQKTHNQQTSQALLVQQSFVFLFLSFHMLLYFASSTQTSMSLGFCEFRCLHIKK